MITQEQRNKLSGKRVLAVLTEDYKPEWLSYTLLKGTVVNITVFPEGKGYLFINGNLKSMHFPYDIVELLEDV